MCVEMESDAVKHRDIEGTETLLQGRSLRNSQLRGLLRRRWWQAQRDWRSSLATLLLPCAFAALAMALAAGGPGPWKLATPQSPLRLEPALYATPEGRTFAFFRSDNETTSSSHSLVDSLVIGPPGGPGLCHGTGFRGGDCGVQVGNDRLSGECLCRDNCHRPENGVPFVAREDGAVLYNLTGRDLPSHLLHTYLLFNEKRYGGWTTEKGDVAKTWFDNSGHHAAPAHLNSLSNAILDSRTTGRHRITTFSHPLQLSAEQLGQATLLHRLGEIGIAFVLLLGASLGPSRAGAWASRDRATEQKRVVMAGPRGVSPALYWAGALVWDLALSVCAALLAAPVIALFNLPAFARPQNLAAVTLLLVSFGWASTPLAHLASRCFSEASLAFMVLFSLNLFVGLVILLAVVALHLLNLTSDAARALVVVKTAALAFPQWGLVGGLTTLAQNQLQADVFARFGQDTFANPISLLLPNLVALLVEGCLFFAINVAIEARILLPVFRWWRLRQRSGLTDKEENQIGEEKNILKLQNVTKVYQSHVGTNYAVDNVTLGVPRGECLGLVGANGAGKTTLFRLLSGQISPTSGSVAIDSREEASVGYCPQKDALDELLTPREHLMVHAQLKGIHPQHIPQAVAGALRELGLDGSHADLPAVALSGGTRRKLCAAIATLGKPDLVLLDEPTSGMDPASRRLLWRRVATAAHRGAAVVVSSHSIQECDVLCSRIAILVNGRIRGLGAPRTLKTQYGGGHTVTFRASEDWDPVARLLQDRLPGAALQARHCSSVELGIPGRGGPSLGEVFGHLEGESLHIQDIAVQQTTLDQVFVGFIRRESEVEADKSLRCSAFSNASYVGEDEGFLSGNEEPLQFSTRL